MQKLGRWLFILTLVGVFDSFMGCTNVPKGSRAEELLAGDHKLRKLIPKTRIAKESSFSGSFFLFMGGVSGQSKEVEIKKVKFAWQTNEGSYAISSLPLEKIQINLVKDIDVPTIKFRWVRSGSPSLQYLMDNHIVHAVITCRENDWPTEIKLPSLEDL